MTLLTWPTWAEDSGYRDTMEGGLFAYAAWGVTEEKCNVDIHPNLFKGDVLLLADGPLKGEFETQTRNYRSEASRADFDYDRTVISSAVALGTVIFLGSTSGSFYHDRSGEFFTASRTSLTEAGLSVVSALEAVYGPATYLTYLDT